eukprot:5599218-Prymnesium_polylepis.2
MPLFVGTDGKQQLQQTPAERLSGRLAALLTASRSRTMDLFRLLDKNSDGMVTRQELAGALAKLGQRTV